MSPATSGDWEMREAEGGGFSSRANLLCLRRGDPVPLPFEPLPPDPRLSPGSGLRKGGGKGANPAGPAAAETPTGRVLTEPHLPGAFTERRLAGRRRRGGGARVPARGPSGVPRARRGCLRLWVRRCGEQGGTRRVADLAWPGPATPPARPLRSAGRGRGQSLPALPASAGPSASLTAST